MTPQRAQRRRPGRGPQVYLAAPYTSVAVSGPSDRHGAKTLIEPLYRRWLESVAGSLEAFGYDVILPHRDVSAWGEAHVPMPVVAERCIAEVLASRAVVAFAAQSFGSHVELGVALGAGIPVVVVSSPDSPLSDFASALCRARLVSEVRLTNGALGGDPRFAETIARALPPAHSSDPDAASCRAAHTFAATGSPSDDSPVNTGRDHLERERI